MEGRLKPKDWRCWTKNGKLILVDGSKTVAFNLIRINVVE